MSLGSSSPVSRATLRVAEGPGSGIKIPLGEGSFVIGRESRAGNDAGSLGGDPLLSRQHARIFARSGALMIEDLGSSNGTFVNDRRVAAATPLHPGDTIKCGSTTLMVEARRRAGDRR